MFVLFKETLNHDNKIIQSVVIVVITTNILNLQNEQTYVLYKVTFISAQLAAGQGPSPSYRPKSNHDFCTSSILHMPS